MIDPATVLAYRQTEYRVFGAIAAILRIGVRCPELVLLHEAYNTRCSAFVSACNPLGAIVAEAVNRQRQQDLAAQLSRLKLPALEGIGQHPTSGWPGEPSYLVPGLARAAAQELGRQFQQNAIIWAGADAVPELILLR
ncbi:MAG TPA: DUF3293 domain-containing protein [Steroidobacteraceae bacterium]|nr:DUF3293 domain-containing protein [Steroidobacteraceae bacterium]